MSNIIDRPRFDCAIGGALALIRAIPRAVPIVHASIGCAYNYYIGGNAGAGYLGGGYCGATSIPSSNVAEKEIVFGGEGRLEEQIRTTVEVVDGDIYVVLSGCMVEMIGDDIRSVSEQLDLQEGAAPVLAVPTPSFKGNSHHGYDQTLELFAREYITNQAQKISKKVNVFGIIPGNDVFYKGNLKVIKRLLALIGVEANTLIGEGETLADIKGAGDASLNIILSDVYAPLAQKAFKDLHGIPSIREQLPVGFLQSERFLKNVASALQIEAAAALVEATLKAEGETYFDYFERLSDSYNDFDFQRYAVIAADSNYAPALSEYVSDELGWIPHLTLITDPVTQPEEKALRARFENYASGLKPKVFFDPNSASLRHYLADSWERNRNHVYYEPLGPLVLFGSSFDKDLAEESGYPFLNISFPVTSRVIFNRAYAGISGGLTLAEDIFALIVAGR
jgi:nitrogenase molybdenum-iron protein beta chain